MRYVKSSIGRLEKVVIVSPDERTKPKLNINSVDCVGQRKSQGEDKEGQAVSGS